MSLRLNNLEKEAGVLGALLQFAICAGLIVVAGSFMARCADAIAEITKLGRLLVGSILLAGATSLPELTVDISAIRMNMPNLAVGDLLGSCLMNLLILAVLDLSYYSRGKMLSKQAAVHALSGSMCAALTSLVALGVLTGKAFEAYAIFNLSPWSLLIAVGYAFGVRLIYFDQRFSAGENQEQLSSEIPVPAGMILRKALTGFGLCTIVILLSGPFMARAAGTLAEESGLGTTFVGTTLVAISTSLPELVSSIAALRLGARDLAIGNIFGSNVFNLLLLVPLDLLHPKPLFAVVSQNHAITCLAAIGGTMIVVMGQLYRVESRKTFIDPDAWLVIFTVVSAMVLLYYLPT